MITIKKISKLSLLFLIALSLSLLFNLNLAEAAPQRTTFLALGHVYPDYEALRLSISIINQERPDFVVFLGDSVPEGEKAAWEELSIITRQITVPVYFIPGNHDLGENQKYKDFFPYLPFKEFTVKANTFIILNTISGEQEGYDISREQINLIKSVYSKPGNNKIILMHNCLFYENNVNFCNDQGDSNSKESNWNKNIVPIIQNKTLAVLVGDSGIEQAYFSYEENKVPYFGIGFSQERDRLKIPQHMLKVIIEGDSLEVIPIPIRQDLTRIVTYPSTDKPLILEIKLFITDNIRIILIIFSIIIALLIITILLILPKTRNHKSKRSKP